MGDIVLTTPFVRALRKLFPNARIDFLLNKSFKEIYEYNTNIDNLILYDRALSKKNIISERDKYLLANNIEHYDIVFDLQNNKRSRAWIAGVGTQIRKIAKNRLHKLSLVYLKQSRLDKDFHVVKNYFATANEYGVAEDGKACEIFTATRHESMTQNSKALIAFAPAAQHYTKQWLPERFVELSDLLKDKYAIMLLGGLADTEICAKIKSDSKAEIIDCSGSTSIIHTLELIRQCSAIVTNDTGVMHIASCTEVPIVAIFGSTVPALGFSPYNAKHSIVENTQLTCRPCTHIGKKKCPKGHFKCMSEISSLEVYNKLLDLL
jgi:heptosyltransferase-2